MKLCAVATCREPHDRQHAYCRKCQAAYVRKWRLKKGTQYKDLPESEKVKSRCRAHTNVLVKRKVLQRGPCCRCGNPSSEAYHFDYLSPTHVHWMCRRCRRELRSGGDSVAVKHANSTFTCNGAVRLLSS